MRAEQVSIVLLGLVLNLGVVHADPQGGPEEGKATTEESRQKMAKDLFDQGGILYRLGKFAQALEKFEASLKITNRPSVILTAAQCHRQLKHYEKALFFYKLYLTEWERQNPDSKSPYEQEILDKITEVKDAIEMQRQRNEEGRKRREEKERQHQLAKLLKEKETRAAEKKRAAEAQLSRDLALTADRRRSKTIWGYSTLGAGAALAVAAAILYGVGGAQGGEAHDSYLKATDTAPTHDVAAVEQYKSDVESARTKLIVGNVLIGLAAASLGVSIYQFVTRPSVPEAPSKKDLGAALSFSPSVGGGSVSLMVQF